MFEDVDGPQRKRLIKLLIIVGIGLPILIEVATFGSLLSHHFVGGDGGDTAVDTPTPEPKGVGVGDEILTESNQTGQIQEASVVTTDDGWRFTLTLNVTNSGQSPAEVRLGTVTTRSGSTVDGTATTGRIPAGESATVTGAWLLPAGERPDTIEVIRTTNPTDGEPETERHTIQFRDIPVSNE